MFWSRKSGETEGQSVGGRSTTGRQIKIWIYGLAAMLIVLSTASLTFIAHLAWSEADRRSLEGDKLRFTTTFKRYKEIIALDQIGLAQWDETYTALQQPLNRDFIEDLLIADLWEQFDLERTFIVGADGRMIVQAIEDNSRFGSGSGETSPIIRRLADRTRESLETRMRQTSAGFTDWYLPQSVLLDVANSAYAVVDGQPALLVAVPVLPDEGRVKWADDDLAVLINAVYFDDAMIAELNDGLNYRDLRFFDGEPPRKHPTNHLIWAADGSVLGYFRWDHEKPGLQIWFMALPLIALMTAIISVVAFAIAAKISRLSTSLEESEQKNHHFANHDALTGLPNRHHFSDRLAFSIDSLPDRGFALFACDLDRFKPINDTFGHEAGDKVLCKVAERFQSHFGKDDVVCRIGGDEFIVLMTKYSSVDELEELANRLRTDMSAPIEIGNGETVQIGVSVGVATAPECGLNDKDLIRMADMALYRAKENGRDVVEFAAPLYLGKTAGNVRDEHKSRSNA